MSIVQSLIEYHNMEPHPEGGHYVEVFKNKDVSQYNNISKLKLI